MSATARDRTKALVLVRRRRLVKTRRIINPFPVIVRMEKKQPRIQNQVSIFISVKLFFRLSISALKDELWNFEGYFLFSALSKPFIFFTIHVDNISLFWLVRFSSVQFSNLVRLKDFLFKRSNNHWLMELLLNTMWRRPCSFHRDSYCDVIVCGN